MKITHILSSISNSSAGPTYSVGALVDCLIAKGEEANLIANGLVPNFWPHKCEYKILGIQSANAELYSFSTISYLQKNLNAIDIAHGHGIWRAANLFPLWMNAKPDGAKILWSPRGMMSEWCMNQGKLKKLIFWKLLQKPALEKVNCFHATAHSEYLDIRRCGFKQPVAIIPNGVVLPDLPSEIKKIKSVLFLGRINNKKGLDLLLHAWAILEKHFVDWQLTIAGSMNGEYAKEMLELTKSLKLKNVNFVGEILGDEKKYLYLTSSLLVLPSFSENFGMVVAEALAHGVPVITTTETPWADIEEKKCGWIIDPSLGSLVETLDEAMTTLNSELLIMGKNGRTWMESDFSWDKIGEKMLETYGWLKGTNAKPECVLID